MKKILIIIGIIIISLIAITFLFLFFTKEKSNIIKTYGNIEIREVDLSFQVSGIIKNVYVEEGDYVKKGQLLAELIDKDYDATYKKAYYQEKSSKAKMKDDLDKYNRNISLCDKNIISKQQCDTYLNNKNHSNATYNEMKANRIYQKNQLDYTKMYAPQNGIITTRTSEIGARVQENQIVYVMSLNKPIWIRTYIKETDLGNIKYGKKATILTDTIDVETNKKKKYSGYIGYISPVAEFTPKTVQTQDLRSDLVYRIRIYIDEADEFLRQGMPVTVEINLDEENDELR